MTNKVGFYRCFFYMLVAAPSIGLEGDEGQFPLNALLLRPFFLSLHAGRGLSPAAPDIWSVSARRPPHQQPLLSSAPCVSTFLWTNMALNNSVCSASTCPGTAVQTRLPGWDVWYSNLGLRKELWSARDQLTNCVFFFRIAITVFFSKYIFVFFFLFFICGPSGYPPIDFFHSYDSFSMKSLFYSCLFTASSLPNSNVFFLPMDQ